MVNCSIPKPHKHMHQTNGRDRKMVGDGKIILGKNQPLFLIEDKKNKENKRWCFVLLLPFHIKWYKRVLHDNKDVKNVSFPYHSPSQKSMVHLEGTLPSSYASYKNIENS